MTPGTASRRTPRPTAATPGGRPATLRFVLKSLTAVLILKVTAAVVVGYRDYFPPDFTSDFLRGREQYFFDGYRWPFYAHIVSGPVSLLLGLTLVSDSFRRRFPQWHRRLGRVQAVCVLAFVAPSGLWMAGFAQSGLVAGAGFAALAVATAACVAFGWRAAVRRRFAEHRRWMTRSFVLLCSAVVLRLIGGLATVLGVEALWFDPLAAWACWLLPLAAFELAVKDRHSPNRSRPAPPEPTVHASPAV